MQRRLVPKMGVGPAHRAAQVAKGYVPPGSSASTATAVTSATPVATVVAATTDGCDSEASVGGAHGAGVPINLPEEEEERCGDVGAVHGGAGENNPQNAGASGAMPTDEDHAMIDEEDAVAAEGDVANGSRARDDDTEPDVLPAKKKPKKKKKKKKKKTTSAVADPAAADDDDDSFEVSHVKATQGPDGKAWHYSARDRRTGAEVRIDEEDLVINAKEALTSLARGRPGQYVGVLFGCRGGGATGAGVAAGGGEGTSHPNGGACSPSLVAPPQGATTECALA